MRVTIAWHEQHSALDCHARLAAELGYLIQAWEGSDCYGSYSTDIFAWLLKYLRSFVLFVQRGWRRPLSLFVWPALPALVVSARQGLSRTINTPTRTTLYHSLNAFTDRRRAAGRRRRTIKLYCKTNSEFDYWPTSCNPVYVLH